MRSSSQQDASDTYQPDVESSLQQSGPHSFSLLLVSLSKGKVASGLGDKGSKIWHVASGHCEKTLTGHTNYVVCPASLSNGKSTGGSDDQSISSGMWQILSATRHLEAVQMLSFASLCLAPERLQAVQGTITSSSGTWQVLSPRRRRPHTLCNLPRFA